MKATDNQTLWAKIGRIKEIALMAKSVIIFGRGCYLEFLNLTTGQNDTLTLNNHKENGDGVKCYQGHFSLYIFAYSESCQRPFIHVKSYPDFQSIARFTGEQFGIKCLAFSESSLLFSLGDMPHYRVTAWNWRSKDKFAESSNELLYENQIIRCSYGRPMYLAQFGVGSTKLFIWDVFTVCKTTLFAKHEVKLGNLKPDGFENVVWSQDSIALYIIDRKGCIYTYDRDFELELVVDVSNEHIIGEILPSICWYHHGLTVSGPNKEIRHYKKVGSAWICDTKYSTELEISSITAGKYEKCIGLSETSEIVTFGLNPDSLTLLRENQSSFTDICCINPIGEFVVVLNKMNTLNVYRMETAEIMSTLTLDTNVASMVEHPQFPFITTGHVNGHLKLISFYNECKPAILIDLNLASFSLCYINFFEQGRLLCTGNLDSGDFIILRAQPGTQVEVLIYLQLGRQICDCMLVASQNMIRFFAIPITQNYLYAGNEIVRYCIVDDRVVNVKRFHFERNHALYRRLFPARGAERDRTLYVLPFNSLNLEMADTKRGSPLITITDTFKTGHQMRRYLFKLTSRHLITWGYDGFVFVRNLDLENVEAMALTHHRYLHGVHKAVTNPSSTIIVSLGTENVLVAVRIGKKETDESLMEDLRTQKSSAKMAVMFKRATLDFSVDSRFAGKCWTEIQRLLGIEHEQEQCRIERNKILEEYQDIERSLQELVTENFEVPENKKLDLLEFYLDTPSYQKKQQQNKEECKTLEIYLKSLIVAQDKTSDYIIKKYYIPMGVQWAQIMGIFSVQKATNYCLLPENIPRTHRLRWIEEQRTVEQYLSHHDTFEPWQTMTKQEIQELVSKRPIVPKDDYAALATVISMQNDPDVDLESYLETKIAICGCVSQLYIPISSAHYRQRQLNTFYQCELQQAVAEREVIKLKQTYNRCFQNTRALKDREMYNIREKNAKLRHIISEFNYFSNRKINVDIVDPEWADIENVETSILRVVDSEVPVRPYVSPSEQAILDAKAAEEERLRLLLLADDFRERALMAMMNGVLEIRWEDELRKEVPKPKCMTEKNPEEYNEDDLRALKDYEEKCAQLKTEREKYKSLLEVEFAKLSTTLRDSIRKFNQKLYECTKFKFYIDSGMNQENLMVNRQRVIQNGRIEIGEKERRIIQSIKDYEATVEEIQRYISFVQDAMVECRNNLETMLVKEKLLEKSYKKDFQDISPVVQEQAYKLYKKRPKVNYRAISTATILNELAKGVVSHETSYAMTQECLDYLTALDNLDMFVGLPPVIDESVWQMICKHRRFRIEYEIRLRAAQIQILDGEATISTFQKRISTKKEKIVMLSAELEQTRQDRLNLIHNKQLQFVLRRGIVEIPLTGDLYMDFQDAILVPKAEIEHVNNLIVEAGKLKLKTIQQNMKFRRTVMAAEWEHTRLRMTINDYIEHKRDIDNVKFTKEMQSYLKNKNLGRKQEMESFEIEIELIATCFENQIKDEKDKLRKVTRQLNAYKASNKQLDQAIKEVNIDVCYYRIDKDYELEIKEKDILKARMSGMLQRNQLVQKIQENHNEILVLQTELELLRLRTFPTFKYKILDE